MRRVPLLIVLAGLVLLVAGCAAGANPEVGTAGADGDVAGFWLGLWHGLIAPVTVIISLFSDTVGIYELHNSGGWYDVGFVFGLGSLVGGGSQGGRARRR